MGMRSGNPEWLDWPDETTPITAGALNNIEDALDNPSDLLSTDPGNLLKVGSDERLMLDPDDLPEGGGGGLPLLGNPGLYTSLPGYPAISRDIEVNFGAVGRARYFPMRIDSPWILRNAALLTTTGTAGAVAHVALYTDPSATMTPAARVALVSGAGFDASSIGAKEATGLDLTLPAAHYVWVVVFETALATLRGWRVATPFLGDAVSNGWVQRIGRNAATVPPPDPGEAPNDFTFGGVMFESVIWLKGEAA